MIKAKKWSRKKKVVVIILSILLFLFVAIIGAGIGVLHWWKTPADYQIVSASDFVKDDTKLIAHRGFRGVAPENTLPAFEEAGKNNFWGAECDTYRTADGVWVVQHDVNTYRMMDFTKNIEKITYDELMKHNTDNGVNIEKYPNLKVCTLEEYLKACKDYGMKAIIELKGKNNTEHYGEIISLVEQYGVETVFISFEENDLIELRKLCDNYMFFLCQKIDDEAIETAERIGNCGIDFNANKEVNFENDAELIKKIQEKGMKIGAWTVDDPELMKQCLDLGIDYITTNAITY